MTKLNHYRSQILNLISIVIFIFFTIICFQKTLTIANDIYDNTQQFGYSYNWLLPQFSFIQGPNIVLKYCNFIIILDTILNFDYRRNYISHCSKTALRCIVYVLIIILTTLIQSFLHFGLISIASPFNVLLHSLLSYFYFYLFCVFWGLLTLGILYSIKIVTSRPLFCFLGGICFLIVEGAQLHFRHYFWGRLSPAVLAKEILINQFQYWEKAGWVYQSNIGFPYANVSAFFDEKINIIIVFLILILYLFIVHLIPLLSIYQNYQNSVAQSYGFIGIPDDKIIEILSNKLNLPVKKRESKRFIIITVGKGIKRKNIYMKKL